eukprot:TRINITY_DN164_c3_g1_i1.p1 TRINITY_DN164_c3_g1~~TRINITY_DN164_c3_g1_i1.p1  ORF type:complete len:620 (+),score=171.07 TRINITY_DN164_c3_g1_i1:17-1876(+)
MEGFLYSLGLTGDTVKRYIGLLATGGLRSPDDLYLDEPSLSELQSLGIDPADARKIYLEINPDGEVPEEDDIGGYSAPSQLSVEPEEEEEDPEVEYAKMKAAYEQMLAGGAVDSEPEDEPDYSGYGATPTQNYSSSALAVEDPYEDTEDEYEKMKAQYEAMLLLSQNAEPEPEPEVQYEVEDEYEILKREYEELSRKIATGDVGYEVEEEDEDAKLAREYQQLKEQLLNNEAEEEEEDENAKLAREYQQLKEQLLQTEDYFEEEPEHGYTDDADDEYERVKQEFAKAQAEYQETLRRQEEQERWQQQQRQQQLQQQQYQQQQYQQQQYQQQQYQQQQYQQQQYQQQQYQPQQYQHQQHQMHARSQSFITPIASRGAPAGRGGLALGQRVPPARTQSAAAFTNSNASTHSSGPVPSPSSGNLPPANSSPNLSRPQSNSPSVASSSPASSPAAGSPATMRNLTPLAGGGIQGVQLVEADPLMKAQIEALKQLALKGDATFGEELTIDIIRCEVLGGENYWSIQLVTNMRQFSHLTFHRLEVRRKYSDFEDLYKKLQSVSNISLPRFPKKRKNGSENNPHLANLMNTIANDPALHCLAIVVQFFDDKLYPFEEKKGWLKIKK